MKFTLGNAGGCGISHGGHKRKGGGGSEQRSEGGASCRRSSCGQWSSDLDGPISRVRFWPGYQSSLGGPQGLSLPRRWKNYPPSCLFPEQRRCAGKRSTLAIEEPFLVSGTDSRRGRHAQQNSAWKENSFYCSERTCFLLGGTSSSGKL